MQVRRFCASVGLRLSSLGTPWLGTAEGGIGCPRAWSDWPHGQFPGHSEHGSPGTESADRNGLLPNLRLDFRELGSGVGPVDRSTILDDARICLLTCAGILTLQVAPTRPWRHVLGKAMTRLVIHYQQDCLEKCVPISRSTPCFAGKPLQLLSS